jgi:hypothetical protein
VNHDVSKLLTSVGSICTDQYNIVTTLSPGAAIVERKGSTICSWWTQSNEPGKSEVGGGQSQHPVRQVAEIEIGSIHLLSLYNMLIFVLKEASFVLSNHQLKA